jgi:hypothetical protein
MNLESLHSLTEDLLNSEIGWKKVYDKNGIVAFTKKNVFGQYYISSISRHYKSKSRKN